MSFFNRLFPTKYKSEDFILTKKYESGGLTKGGLVLQVEHVLNENLACSKGSFQIKNGNLEWVMSSDKLIQISISNIERKLTKEEAVKILSQNVKKIKKS